MKKIFLSAIITSTLLLAETECVNNDDIKKIVEFNESKIASYQRYISILKKQIKDLKVRLGEKSEADSDVKLDKEEKISYSASNKTFVYTKPDEAFKTTTLVEIGKDIDIVNCNKDGWCISSDNLYFKKFLLRIRMLE